MINAKLYEGSLQHNALSDTNSGVSRIASPGKIQGKGCRCGRNKKFPEFF